MTKNYILLFLIITSSSSSFTHAIDTITTTQIFTDNGGSLISSAGRFELGFFSPNDSHNRYVGIWYKKIIPRTVVWVANHENPLTDTTDTSRLNYVDTHPDESRPNNDLELPLFDLVTLTKATDSFSLDNKLGEGGFGPLYKARLDDGQEIAVKCLSKTPFKE